MDRQPIVAGQFYTNDPGKLRLEVESYLALGRERAAEPGEGGRTLLTMVPHAGYVFSGAVAGLTLGLADLSDTILLLGPKHTGRGHPLAVWPEGRWLTPLGGLKVDAELARALVEADPRLAMDEQAHLEEHSLEVVIPFLELVVPGVRIVPVAVAETRYGVLEDMGRKIAATLAELGREVTIVVSSDMSHYVSHQQAKALDSMALKPALALDPAGMYRTVEENRISMCGIRPMAMGLCAALEMGATRAELTAYRTSGDVSGDFSQVVGYAGMLVS